MSLSASSYHSDCHMDMALACASLRDLVHRCGSRRAAFLGHWAASVKLATLYVEMSESGNGKCCTRIREWEVLYTLLIACN